MKHFRLAAVSFAIAAFTAAGASYAADSGLSRGDSRFLQRAAQSGMLEIEASKLAVERAQSPQVKEFAQKMITDHTAVDKELRALAQSKKVELPTDLRWGQGRTMKGLQKDEGADFDERYVDKVAVDAHEDAVELFEEASKDAEDAEVKAFAAKTLPSLQQHLQMGESLQNAMKDRPENTADRGGAGVTDTSPSSTRTPTSGASNTTGGSSSAGAAGAGGTGASGTGAGTAGSGAATGAGTASPGAAPSPGATPSPGAAGSSSGGTVTGGSAGGNGAGSASGSGGAAGGSGSGGGSGGASGGASSGS